METFTFTIPVTFTSRGENQDDARELLDIALEDEGVVEALTEADDAEVTIESFPKRLDKTEVNVCGCGNPAPFGECATCKDGIEACGL